MYVRMYHQLSLYIHARCLANPLRHCLSNSYATAEMHCYHWADGLANAIWTRLGQNQRMRGRGWARFLGGRGAMGGIPADQ